MTSPPGAPAAPPLGSVYPPFSAPFANPSPTPTPGGSGSTFSPLTLPGPNSSFAGDHGWSKNASEFPLTDDEVVVEEEEGWVDREEGPNGRSMGCGRRGG